MARKIELKSAILRHNFNGNGEAPVFTWAEMMSAILYLPPKDSGGIAFDDVVKCVKATEAIDQAVEAKADCVKFSEESYQVLKTKLDQFKFAFADPAFVEFGLAIKNAPEIT